MHDEKLFRFHGNWQCAYKGFVISRNHSRQVGHSLRGRGVGGVAQPLPIEAVAVEGSVQAVVHEPLESGYRVSWEAANGQTSRDVFHSNTRAWSGDHCVDPSVVPGVLFCNQPLLTEHPRLLDIAPTVLNVFGIEAPAYMDGKVLSIGDRSEVTHEAPRRSPAQVI